MNRFITSFLIAIAILSLCSFQVPPKKKQDPAFVSIQNKWVDSVYNSLSPDERIAQLFMIAAYSNKDLKHVKEISDLVTNYNIGGLIWMQGGPLRQSQLANYYQSIAKTPLLYSMDAEWGLAMRLDSVPRYPKQMTLGAIQNDSLIYQLGSQIAKECKRMGVHVSFSPVADVNNNPLNPVIGMRSFGENKFKVAQKAAMYMQGLQDQHVMATGKHFPGHGDTDSDSHLSLPSLSFTRARLDTLEFYPFRYLFDRGLASIMVAHLNVPSLDTSKNLPTTLSPRVVTDLLKTEMGFKGLIFTDALNMKGVSAAYEPGKVDVMALLAGNDILLFSGDVPKALLEIKKAIVEGKITQQLIDERCMKLLRAKYWCGLNIKQEIASRNLAKEINSKESADLNDRLAEASITLLKNENNFLPLKQTDSLRILEISFGEEEENALISTMRNYGYAEHVGLKHDADTTAVRYMFSRIRESDLVVIQINKASAKPDNNYGVGEQTLRLIDTIARLRPTTLVLLTNPYLLNKVKSLTNFRAVIMAYENLPSLLKASGNAIMGVSKVNGKLPVSTQYFKSESGLTLPPPIVSNDQMKEKFFLKKFGAIDSIALAGIAEQAYPGCQIVAMKNGEIIYQKSFGSYTYSKYSKQVDNGTMYDLASVTKIAASSLALMKLRSDGKFDYTKKLEDYLPDLQGTDKGPLLIEDVLTHQAGLQSWIPFYQSTLKKNSEFKPGYYSNTRTELFPTQVATNLYVVKGMNDSIYKRLVSSKIEKPGTYLYSDLGYYFMQQIIEFQSKKKINDYVQSLYADVGIGLRYTPLNYFSRLQIAPTENDEKFRKQIIQGYVHDPGAALMGGVAAHAGLFGNALDLAKLMQLYLNKGELNGVRILDSNVVKEFTSCHFCPTNRRGLCFEKPELDATKDSPVTAECSPESFGHSGFTGTFAWADPKNKLVIVFLSNRVYPNAEDNKLTKLAIRSKIHKAFYDALKN
ncbi:MAG: glycoside hydrolase family 3 N-terminal domain-containing protein [bacterium]|nr:glycoside hydrolase family 3 N-terminal domain-containing protein [bacterium]